MNHKDLPQSIFTELESVRDSFHAVMNSFSEKDLQRQSLNPGWTNGEIMAHMLFGFIVVMALLPMVRIWGKFPKGSSLLFAKLLNSMTTPFNWVNALGARLQSRVFTYKRIGKLYDRLHISLLRTAASITDSEWQQGMYFPTNWDANFSEFMTLEKLFHYPVIHFNFHITQIAFSNSD
jgi:hypothetical protein